jgi:HK97 family phage major capsid protein
MSIRKQIEALQKKRNAHLDGMTALSDTAANENRLFTEDEQKGFDKDQADVRDIDAQLEKLIEAEKQLAGRAQPVPSPSPHPTPEVEVRAYKPFKGQGFVRVVLAVGRTKGNFHAAAELASRWRDQTPEVEAVLRTIAQTGEMPGEVLRAAVNAGTTTSPTWAGPLVYAQNLASEFIEFLRPATIVGRLPLRPVPFNVSIPRQTGAATAQWVGEGQSKPVSQLSFERTAIPWAKTSVIAVITDELARFADPSAEMLVRDDLVAAIAQYHDQQFSDPTVAPLANIRPGAVTNGTAEQVIVVPSSGLTIANILNDVSALMKAMAAANLPMTEMRWLMTPTARITLQYVRTAMDLPAFPEVSQGLFRGIQITESNNIPTATGANAGQTDLVLLDCSQIFHASDPVVDVQASNEASLQMDTAPAAPPAPLVSLWQQNMLGIRAEQYQYWVRRHDKVVGYISGFQT